MRTLLKFCTLINLVNISNILQHNNISPLSPHFAIFGGIFKHFLWAPQLASERLGIIIIIIIFRSLQAYLDTKIACKIGQKYKVKLVFFKNQSYNTTLSLCCFMVFLDWNFPASLQSACKEGVLRVITCEKILWSHPI
jgi:hypothetical protein